MSLEPGEPASKEEKGQRVWVSERLSPGWGCRQEGSEAGPWSGFQPQALLWWLWYKERLAGDGHSARVWH